jgi:A/G-specific adenine glycosylase
MLQQTQVATAIPYYERFVERFPDARSLARAKPAQVLAVWAGLGYYRRARHLREAAAIVVREHAGRVPSEPIALAALPGVGRYTLGAVLSIGFGKPWPVLDGNVARVLARWTAASLSVRRPADAKRLWALAESLVPGGAGSRRARAAEHPGDWNQALMELGALVCTPRSPRCEACPVARHCRARALGLEHRLPPVPPRRAAVHVRRAVALVQHRGRLLVVRRKGPVLHGLWEPPGVELGAGEEAAGELARELARLGVRVRLHALDRSVRHTITHRDIRVELYEGTLAGRVPRATGSRRWAGSAAGDGASTTARHSLALTALGARLVRESRR